MCVRVREREYILMRVYMLTTQYFMYTMCIVYRNAVYLLAFYYFARLLNAPIC